MGYPYCGVCGRTLGKIQIRCEYCDVLVHDGCQATTQARLSLQTWEVYHTSAPDTVTLSVKLYVCKDCSAGDD